VNEGIESSPAEKDLGILGDEKLDMSRQCALAAQQTNHTLGCIPSSMGSRAREGILSLCSAETPLGVLHPALEPSAQDRPGPVGAGPEEAPAMIRGLEHLCCEDRLRELGLFSLERRRHWGELIAAFQSFKGAYKKEENRLFSRDCCDTTRGNGFKLKERRYKKEILYCEHGETLDQVAQRGGRCPIPRNIQGQAGQGSEQPDLVEDIPAYCKGVGLDDL